MSSKDARQPVTNVCCLLIAAAFSVTACAGGDAPTARATAAAGLANPGEALHCAPLSSSEPADVAAFLTTRGYKIAWRHVSEGQQVSVEKPPSGTVLTGAAPLDTSEAVLFLGDPDDEQAAERHAAFVEQLTRGCDS